MEVIELSRIAAEVERFTKFLESIGLHPAIWKASLIEIERAAVQKGAANNRQMVIDFNRNKSDVMRQRWNCSRSTAFRKRDKAAKECQNAPHIDTVA